MSFPVLLDPKGQLTLDYGIRGTPAHLLIDKQGDIKAYAPGYKDWNSKESYALIKHLIDMEN